MGTQKQTQDDLKRRELVLPIKAAKRQEGTKQADLHMNFTVDEGINFKKMRLCKNYLKNYLMTTFGGFQRLVSF